MINIMIDFFCTNLISIFCIVTMIVFFSVDKDINKSIKKYFLALGTIVFIELIRTYIDDISLGIPKFLVACFGYILRPLLMYIIALTMMRDMKKSTRILVGIPFFADIILIIFGFLMGDFVYTLSQNDYCYGIGIEIVKASILYFLILIILIAFTVCKKSKLEAIVVLTTCSFLIINYLDQTLYGFLPYDMQNTIISLSILIYYMYFSAQKHIIQIDEKDNEILKTKIQTTLEIVDQAINTLAYTIDAKDKYTRGHSVRVAKYSQMIAKRAGMSQEECHEIYLMGLLHDIGKISISDSVINKPGKLIDDEYDLIKNHPTNGAKILERMVNTPYLQEGAKYHHERYDGKGYPCGLSGEEIPIRARIIAVADAYDAMTSCRSYRDVLDQSLARQEIWKGAGTQFDPFFAKIMISYIDSDIDYDMREKTDVQDEILVGETYEGKFKEQNIVKLNDEEIRLQATDITYFGTFIKTTDFWAVPKNRVKILEDTTTFTFISKSFENANRIWHCPCLLFYSANDGEVDGSEYVELAVIKATGYGWKTAPALDDKESIVRKSTFTNWDNWITDCKKGMLHHVSVSKAGNTISAVIDNSYLTIDIKVLVPDDYNKDIFVAVTGEKCVIENFYKE